MEGVMFGVLFHLMGLLALASAQESVNAHEGFNVGMHAAIALVISFSILTTFAISVNVIKKKCVKVIP